MSAWYFLSEMQSSAVNWYNPSNPLVVDHQLMLDEYWRGETSAVVTEFIMDDVEMAWLNGVACLVEVACLIEFTFFLAGLASVLARFFSSFVIKPAFCDDLFKQTMTKNIKVKVKALRRITMQDCAIYWQFLKRQVKNWDVNISSRITFTVSEKGIEINK